MAVPGFSYGRLLGLVAALTLGQAAVGGDANARAVELKFSRDGQGRITRWAYDDVGRLLSRTLPEGQTETFEYDAVGNRTTHTAFDAQGCANVAGAGCAGATDEMGRLTQITYPGGQLIDYGYDARGNKVSLKSGAHSITYRYTALNQLESLTEGSETTEYVYDELGRQREVRYPNGAVTTTAYDTLSRPLLVETKDAAGALIARTAYTLDDAGHRTRLEELDRTVDYTYDALYRLTSETVTDQNKTRTTTWTYDKVGNRLTQDVDGLLTTYEYDDNDRLLTETTGGQVTRYTYDANGNTLSKSGPEGTVTYTWNQDGRLIGASDGSQTLAFTYDANGIRQSRTVDGATTEFLVDPNQTYAQVLGEYQSGAEQVFYTYGSDLLRQSRASGSSYYHYDALGSTRALTDGEGSLSDAYAYKAFGEVDRQSGETPNSYLFTGEQFEPGLKQYYLRQRYMDPRVGRFAAVDLWNGRKCSPLTQHKYLYADLDPVGKADPSGRMSLMTLSAPVSIGLSTGTMHVSRTWVVRAAVGVSLTYVLHEITLSLNEDASDTARGESASEAAQRQAEYEKAKAFCDTPPEPGGNACSTLSRQIDHAEQCISIYEEWDAKWFPGRHDEKLAGWRNRINNLKLEHRAKCTNK